MLALPYADDAFDVVWCANTSQQLGDEELATVLAEFRRVVRRGTVQAAGPSWARAGCKALAWSVPR